MEIIIPKSQQITVEGYQSLFPPKKRAYFCIFVMRCVLYSDGFPQLYCFCFTTFRSVTC